MEFYSINFNSNNVELFVEVVGEYDEQRLKNGEYNPSCLEVIKSQGRKAYDIVRLQDVYNFLISERLRKSFEDANLTGWKTYKIKTQDLDNGYVGFQCTGKSGEPIRPSKSGFVTGFQFDQNSWDGSDFFMPESTLAIVCTQSAKDVIEKYKIKNIKITNVKSFKWYSV